jgi:hypothetical protein
MGIQNLVLSRQESSFFRPTHYRPGLLLLQWIPLKLLMKNDLHHCRLSTTREGGQGSASAYEVESTAYIPRLLHKQLALVSQSFPLYVLYCSSSRLFVLKAVRCALVGEVSSSATSYPQYYMRLPIL